MKMDEYELQEKMGWNVVEELWVAVRGNNEGNMDGVVKKDAIVNGKMTNAT